MPIKPKPWYSRLGPFAWYRSDRLEWVAFDLTWGSWLLLTIHWKPRRLLWVCVGGTVHNRSMYGRPSTVEPLFDFWLPKFTDYPTEDPADYPGPTNFPGEDD